MLLRILPCCRPIAAALLLTCRWLNPVSSTVSELSVLNLNLVFRLIAVSTDIECRVYDITPEDGLIEYLCSADAEEPFAPNLVRRVRFGPYGRQLALCTADKKKSDGIVQLRGVAPGQKTTLVRVPRGFASESVLRKCP